MKNKIKQPAVAIYLLLPAIVLSSILMSVPAWAESQFYFIRHAEFEKTDPAKPLNRKGKLRAKALVNYLSGEDLTHIYATHTDRTRDTVMPLAKQRNLIVKQFPLPGSEVKGSKVTNLSKGKVAIKPMIAALKNIPDGSKVIVSANSGNLYAIMAGLGVPVNSQPGLCAVTDNSCLPCKKKSCFPGKEFHNIWKVTITNNAVEMTNSQYGEVPQQTSNFEAHDSFLRGWEHYRRETPADFGKAAFYFKKAIQLDPDDARAHAALAAVYWNSAWRSWLEPFGLTNSEMLVQSKKLLKRAMQSPSALTHQVASEMAAYSRRKPKKAFAEADTAIALDANDPAGYLAMANAQLKAKMPAETIASMQKAMQLDPHYPSSYLTRLGRALFDLGQYDKAVSTLESATKSNPEDDRALIYLAAAYGHLGRKADAISMIDSVNKLRYKNRWGNLTIAEIDRWRWTGDRKRLKAGLVLAEVKSGIDWLSRITNWTSGEEMKIDGVTIIGLEQAKELHDAGVPFIDYSQIGTAQKSIHGTHYLRWGRDRDMGPRAFNLVRLLEITTKPRGMVIYHSNGTERERWTATVAAYAAELGFENVYYLRDGLDDWKKMGYPVESGK